jgi:hypothetical protein
LCIAFCRKDPDLPCWMCSVLSSTHTH